MVVSPVVVQTAIPASCFLPSFRETTMDDVSKEINIKSKKKKSRGSKLSFSASLPDNVCEVFADSFCAVKISIDPSADFRESILEMIRDVGVRNWEEMEELVYCYVVLNSPELHGFIGDAFLSLCCSYNHLR